MRTQIRFVDGEESTFDETAEIKLSAHGVEVIERDGEDVVKVLFPWTRIDRVTQRGPEVAAIYTW